MTLSRVLLRAVFDPSKTILLDYTADCGRKVTYRDWGVLGQFPWIFGIFHGFARNSDVHEDYGILTPRLRGAAADQLSQESASLEAALTRLGGLVKDGLDSSAEPR